MIASKSTAILVATVLAAALGSACGQRAERAPSKETLDTFVGEVRGSPAYIALITDGERLSGFLTDGKQYGRWFATADLDDDQASLVARDGSELGKVSISGDSASGEVIVGLASDRFDARRTSGKARLFTTAEQRGEDSIEAGWIVLADGSERGTYETSISDESKTQPAPPLRPTVSIPGFGAQVPHQVLSLFLDSNAQAP